MSGWTIFASEPPCSSNVTYFSVRHDSRIFEMIYFMSVMGVYKECFRPYTCLHIEMQSSRPLISASALWRRSWTSFRVCNMFQGLDFDMWGKVYVKYLLMSRNPRTRKTPIHLVILHVIEQMDEPTLNLRSTCDKGCSTSSISYHGAPSGDRSVSDSTNCSPRTPIWSTDKIILLILAGSPPLRLPELSDSLLIVDILASF